MTIHTLEIHSAPKRWADQTWEQYFCFCSCGAYTPQLKGWYYTEAGAKAWGERHVAIAKGEIDTTSTSSKEHRIRNFMDKVDQHHPEDKTDDEPLPKSKTTLLYIKDIDDERP
jgi:hypothetical protein